MPPKNKRKLGSVLTQDTHSESESGPDLLKRLNTTDSDEEDHNRKKRRMDKINVPRETESNKGNFAWVLACAA
jgi:hypothetical protein